MFAMSRTRGCILTAVLLLPGGTVLADDGVSLAPKFEAGTRHHYVSRSIVRHGIAAELLETKQEVTVRTESGMAIVVASVSSNGEAELEWTTHYMKLSTDGAIPGIDAALDYDSRVPAPSTSPLAPTFASIIGKPFHIRVSRSGDILSFETPQIYAGPDAVSQLAQSFFSKEAFAQLPLFVTLGAPAKVNYRDAWQRREEIAFPLGGTNLELLESFTCARRKPRRQSVRLNMTGTISAVSAGPQAVNGLDPLQGAALTVESGTVKGEYEWDYAYGRLLAAESQLDLVTALNTRVGRMQLEQHLTGSVALVDERAFERKVRAPHRTKRGGR